MEYLGCLAAAAVKQGQVSVHSHSVISRLRGQETKGEAVEEEEEEEARPRKGAVRFQATRGQRGTSFQGEEGSKLPLFQGASHTSAITAGPADTSWTCGAAETPL